jgi:hypothetical protein
MEDDDPKIVLHRCWELCTVRTPPGRCISKSMPLEEIPLLRKLAMKMGGKLTIHGGMIHQSFGKYLIQGLTRRQVQTVAKHHQESYNGRQVGGVTLNLYDDVYGHGENDQLISKMQMLSKKFIAAVPMDGDTSRPDPEQVEKIIREVFPHLSTDQSADVLDLPGFDGLEADPEVEAAAGGITKPDDSGTIGSQPVEADDTAVGLVGDAGRNVELIAFLQSPMQTNNKPFSSEQAEALSGLLADKPIEEWEKADWERIPGLDVRSRQRVERVLRAFYDSE